MGKHEGNPSKKDEPADPKHKGAEKGGSSTGGGKGGTPATTPKNPGKK